MTGEEARVRGVVLEVLRELVSARGARGVVVGAPPSPEGALLERWCRGEVLVERVPEGLAESVTAALRGGSEEGWAAAATAVGSQTALLVVHPATKTRLLLEAVPHAACYPLGDLWASQVEGWCGGTTLPRILASEGPDSAALVEGALRRGLDQGMGVASALAALDPGLREAVHRGLEAGRFLARPPVIPKLGAWTLGVDPAP